MKKSLLVLTSMLTMGLGTALAQIPNAGFEEWETDQFAAKNPKGWYSLNALSAFGYPVGVVQSPEAKSGSSAIKLTVDEYTPFAILDPQPKKDTAVGFAITGKIVGASLDGGISGYPFNGRPALFSGHYKLTLPKEDTAFISVFFTKWNATTNEAESIGGTFATFTEATNVYKSFSAPIFYDVANVMPDTAIITILASAAETPIPGTTLFIDDLAFSGGIANVTESVSFSETKVFPNPATSDITIENAAPTVVSISILDVAGKVIANEPVASHMNIKYNVENLNNGLYLFELKNSSNQLVQRGKFSVAK